MLGIHPGGIHRFRDKRINVGKLRPADLHVHAAQKIYPVGYRLPAEGDKIADIQIQIFIQHLCRIAGAAVKISPVNLIVAAVVVNI